MSEDVGSDLVIGNCNQCLLFVKTTFRIQIVRREKGQK
jgi:hypothetical protein